MELNIDRLIKKEIDKEQDKEREKGVFYASELGSCSRKIYYSVVDKQPIAFELRKIFWIGETFHEFLQQVIPKHAQDIKYSEAERRVMITTDDFDIHGKIDLFLVDKDNRKHVYEFKTMAATSIKDNINGGWKDVPVSKGHIWQLMIYMRAERIKEANLVQINKKNFQIKVHKIQYDEKIYKEIINKIGAVNNCLSVHQPPPPDAELWECKWCPYNNKCWGDNPDWNEVQRKLDEARRPPETEVSEGSMAGSEKKGLFG